MECVLVLMVVPLATMCAAHLVRPAVVGFAAPISAAMVSAVRLALHAATGSAATINAAMGPAAHQTYPAVIWMVPAVHQEGNVAQAAAVAIRQAEPAARMLVVAKEPFQSVVPITSVVARTSRSVVRAMPPITSVAHFQCAVAHSVVQMERSAAVVAVAQRRV